MTDERTLECALDASALLAVLQGEPEGASVTRRLAAAAMSAVNWSEVVQKAEQHGLPTSGLRSDLEAVGLRIAPFAAEDAEQVAALWPVTARARLSLADRACLALGQRLGLEVVTKDHAMGSVPHGVTVVVI